MSAQVTHAREFVPIVNDAALAGEPFEAARSLFGNEAVSEAAEAMTGSEDFARFPEHVPGCFVFMGNGRESPPLHNPDSDFDDAGLIHGTRYHVGIARRRLGPAA